MSTNTLTEEQRIYYLKSMGIEVWQERGVQKTPAALLTHDLSWEKLEAQVKQCQSCSLHQTRTQTVLGVGNRTADLLIIGEAPGAQEDLQGEPFVGRAGKLLDAM